MRFTKLAVESFQGIQSAEVEFGPALNVLYGPNDLGKSTLATALHAALLVPPTSAAAELFVPWHADAVPRVRLTFVDDAGSHWRVEKRFGSAAQTSALLEHSKDGVVFSPDSKARQVDERLRALLGWGIPAPGGKSGPRGLPSSFLSNVLLGAQTEVDEILKQSLAGDADGSGKLRLTKALAALAQDPLFKRTLDAAQREVEQYFTATGQRKRGQASRFTEASNQVKQLESELAELEHQRADSRATEERVARLRELRAEAVLRVADAERHAGVLDARLAQARLRAAAERELELARAALDALDALGARVERGRAQLAELTALTAVHARGVACAAKDKEDAVRLFSAAEAALRAATSEDGARQLELSRAQLAERAAFLGAERQALEARKAQAEAARAARSKAAQAASAASEAAAQAQRLAAALVPGSERVAQAEAGLALVGSIMAYGRWRVAASAGADASLARAGADSSRREAAKKQAEAQALAAEAKAAEARLGEALASLPSAREVEAFAAQERALALAEASLGGGLSVSLRPQSGVRVQARVDGASVLDAPALREPRHLEAERSVQLTIAGQVEIEISAGGAEQRREVDRLRAGFRAQVVPRLEAAGVTSVVALAAALRELGEQRAEHAELKERAERLQAESRAALELAAARDEQAQKLAASTGDLLAREALFAGPPRALLEQHWEKLGKSWEAQAEALRAEKQAGLERVRAAAAAEEQAARDATYRHAELGRRSAELAELARAAEAALGGAELEPLCAQLTQELSAVARKALAVANEQAALHAQASQAVEAAKRAHAAALTQLTAAKAAQASAEQLESQARAELHDRTGGQRALAAQLESMDRAGAEARVRECSQALARLPAGARVSEPELLAAHSERELAARALEQAKEELYKSEGALSKVGGVAVHEEVLRLGQALAGARARERELELDADAWKLLVETLRSVENEQGAHLGRSLAQPVTAKFAELTGGRYRDFKLDAALKAEALEVSSTGNSAGVIAALSAGTRDQLATLLRLTIADQLKSAIVLDDHLVHTDARRLGWFRNVLLKTALNAQVIVLTCRPEDYLSADELPLAGVVRDLAGGSIRSIDVSRLLTRWSAPPARREPAPHAVQTSGA